MIIYRNQEFSIEVKSLQTNSIEKIGGIWHGKAQCDGSDRRVVTFDDGTTLTTTCLLTGEFDLLAINCFAFQGRWDFAFARNEDLPRSTFKKYTPEQQKKLLASLVPVRWPPSPPFYQTRSRCSTGSPRLEAGETGNESSYYTFRIDLGPIASDRSR